MKNYIFTILLIFFYYSTSTAQNSVVIQNSDKAGQDTNLFQNNLANSHFSLSPSEGCEPLTVFFTNNNPGNGYLPVTWQTTGFTYSWDFGNGVQSSEENPDSVIYFDPGDYTVQYSVTIDTIGFYLTHVEVTDIGCEDPFGGDPDIYLEIIDGDDIEVFNNQGSPIEGQPPFNFTLNIHLNNPPYYIRVWDDDLLDANDNCIDGEENEGGTPLTFPPNDPTGFGNTIIYKTNVSLSFNYSISKTAYQYSDSGTVHVDSQLPAAIISASPGTSNYHGDPVTLSVYDDYQYEWYLNDILIPGATGSSYVAYTSGYYSVRIIDTETTCEIITDSIDIAFFTLNNRIKVYPNPNDGQFTLSIDLSEMQDVKISMYDVIGKRVYYEMLPGISLTYIKDFNLYNLTNGIYILDVEFNGEEVFRKKIMIY
ncbi:MAG: T9SS type A sorting domain-containing protein [Bacteroidota bacterium]